MDPLSFYPNTFPTYYFLSLLSLFSSSPSLSPLPTFSLSLSYIMEEFNNTPKIYIYIYIINKKEERVNHTKNQQIKNNQPKIFYLKQPTTHTFFLLQQRRRREKRVTNIYSFSFQPSTLPNFFNFYFIKVLFQESKYKRKNNKVIIMHSSNQDYYYYSYSRSDFREQYCINERNLTAALERSKSTNYLFSCIGSYGDANNSGSSPCKRGSNPFTSCYSSRGYYDDDELSGRRSRSSRDESRRVRRLRGVSLH
jgi:hypothetical protein